MVKKMVRDAFGDAVPQTLNDDGSYTVMANGDTTNVDFGKHKLLRDALGDPLPYQYFDAEQGKFVAGAISGGGGSNPNPSYGGKFQWRYNAATNSLDLVVLP